MTQYDGTFDSRRRRRTRTARGARTRTTRVTGLISGLRSEGLDEEESAQIRRADALRPASRRSGVGHVRTRKGSCRSSSGSNPISPRSKPRCSASTTARTASTRVTGEPIDPERLDALPHRAHECRSARVRGDGAAAAVRHGPGGGGASSDEFSLADGARTLPRCSRGGMRSLRTASSRPCCPASRVWVNGDEPGAGLDTVLADGDEVAVLPPVSGAPERANPPVPRSRCYPVLRS